VRYDCVTATASNGPFGDSRPSRHCCLSVIARHISGASPTSRQTGARYTAVELITRGSRMYIPQTWTAANPSRVLQRRIWFYWTVPTDSRCRNICFYRRPQEIAKIAGICSISHAQNKPAVGGVAISTE